MNDEYSDEMHEEAKGIVQMVRNLCPEITTLIIGYVKEGEEHEGKADCGVVLEGAGVGLFFLGQAINSKVTEAAFGVAFSDVGDYDDMEEDD